MLPYRSHHRVASKHHPERERRLACFANTNDDDGTLERGPQPPPLEQPASAEGVDAMTGSVRQKIDRVRPLLAQATVNSPFVLRMSLEEMRRVNDANVEHHLDNPQIAAAIAKSFDERRAHYQELVDHIGDTDPAKLAELENTMRLSGQAPDVDDTLQQLGIDTTQVSPDTHSPTEAEKWQLIQKKLSAARKLAIIEQSDLGSETSLGSTEDTLAALDKQMNHARKHLERTVQHRAEELRAAWQQLQRQITTESDSTSVAAIADHLGISVSATQLKMASVEDTLQRALRVATSSTSDYDANNLPATHDDSFTANARVLLEQLEDLAWLEDTETAKDGFVEVNGDNQAASLEWLADRAPLLKRTLARVTTDPEVQAATEQLSEVVGEELVTSLEHLSAVAENTRNQQLSAQDREDIFQNLDATQRRQLDLVLASVASLVALRQLTLDAKAIQADTTTNTEEVRDNLFEQLDYVTGTLFTNGTESAPRHPLLKHETAVALGVSTQLGAQIEDCYTRLQQLSQRTGTDPKANEEIRTITRSIQKLQEAITAISSIESTVVEVETPEEFAAICGSPTIAGCYNRADGNIYINTSYIRNNEHRESVIHHEMGHALVHTLTHRVGVLPQLLVGLQSIAHSTMNDGTTLMDKLKTRADDWALSTMRQRIYDQELRRANGNEALAEQRTEDRFEDLLLDELINKYATWQHQGTDDGFGPEDLAILRAFDAGEEPDYSLDTENLTEPEDIQLAHTETEDEATSDVESSAPEATSTISTGITNAQNKFLLISEFIKNHKKWKGVDVLESVNEQWKKFFDTNVRDPFFDRSQSFNEKQIEKYLEKISNEYFSIVDDTMTHAEQAQMNQAASTSGQKGIRGLISNIAFVSINDVIGTFKAGFEDLQRMWKRRGENVQSNLGIRLTEWVPDWVPYAGQLKHEYNRRAAASEIEEVNQWKESLKDTDSFGLQDLLANAQNTDQTRAICELLTERGRLDWNDVNFWKTLKRLSGMNMPIDACRNNGILRDKWLREMINFIWQDKDKYYEWRQANDSGISSGKGKFTQIADQLSNVDAGLKGTLERQLMLWVNGKKSGNIPDEVNPHLYEEALHYAMRNGKMSMEQKMFYLVQGIRYGLMSIDRLQALAGENGGVLNQFPMIDYFTAGNNTMPEITAIGKRLDESGKDKFSPGPKTTIWMHLEVLRNENAKSRITKATSGTRAENIDHEDIPTVMAQADYTTVERMLDIVSGGREKMSPEAVKNSYTGFGTKFTVLSSLAELDMLTEEDIHEAAKSIAAYVHYDNIVTRNGKAKQDRYSKLSWAQINQSSPSSGNVAIQKFREANNGFVKDVLHELGPALDLESLGVSADTLIRGANDTTDYVGDDTRDKNFKAIEEFSMRIAKVLQDNPDILKKILKQNSAKFKAENNFDLSKEKMAAYLEVRRQHGSLGQSTATV